MDSLWTLLLVTTSFIILCFSAIFLQWKLFNNHTKKPSKIPLGSFGFRPFIGETIHFISCAYSDRPECFTNKRRQMYGDVFKSHLFGSPTIVSTDAEVNRVILQSDSTKFVPSYPKSLMELMGKTSILVVNGALQRRIHGLIGNFLKSPFLKAQITADMQKYVTQSMENWREDCLVYIQDEAKNIAFRVLVKALISVECGDEMELLKKHFQEFIAGLMSLPINLPGTQLYRSLQAKRKMIKLIDAIIQSKRDQKNFPGAHLSKDVIDALMNDTSGLLTDELIAENMIDLMIPGEDSVPLLVTLAIKYLSDSPAALKQLTVITETLRMGNIITGVMRKATKDVEIKGLLIPKNWCVFAYFRSVHLDDRVYDSPYQFSPWRWQDREVSSANFSPFGGGQRLCPGHDLARLEASIFLHHLVTQFRWEAEDDTIINFPTVRMKNRMPVWVKRRDLL
ncbi:cytochrome P450 family protein [Striga asiatica]|uniref:Cytochrome P450 family protein n=1 Tax=Striga asiatica TaxID=4170 RepID=A0A5A7R899_STRAF|nr:cytochrome P450 family protein [Striga asiatica]